MPGSTPHASLRCCHAGLDPASIPGSPDRAQRSRAWIAGRARNDNALGRYTPQTISLPAFSQRRSISMKGSARCRKETSAGLGGTWPFACASSIAAC